MEQEIWFMTVHPREPSVGGPRAGATRLSEATNEIRQSRAATGCQRGRLLVRSGRQGSNASIHEQDSLDGAQRPGAARPSRARTPGPEAPRPCAGPRLAAESRSWRGSHTENGETTTWVRVRNAQDTGQGALAKQGGSSWLLRALPAHADALTICTQESKPIFGR